MIWSFSDNAGVWWFQILRVFKQSPEMGKDECQWLEVTSKSLGGDDGVFCFFLWCDYDRTRPFLVLKELHHLGLTFLAHHPGVVDEGGSPAWTDGPPYDLGKKPRPKRRTQGAPACHLLSTDGPALIPSWLAESKTGIPTDPKFRHFWILCWWFCFDWLMMI